MRATYKDGFVMADYFTESSMIINDLTKVEAAWVEAAVALEPEDMNEEEAEAFGLEEPENGWGFCAEYEAASKSLWIHHDDSINTDHAAAFIRRFLAMFRPDKTFVFEYANTCSKPRIDSFGGGCVIVTAKGFRTYDSSYVPQMVAELDKLKAKLEEMT